MTAPSPETSETSETTAREVRLELDHAAHIATIILDRPRARNALTPTMGDQLARIVDELREDARIRVVILRGEGEAFSSGGDLGFIDGRRARANEKGACALGTGSKGEEENRREMFAFYTRFLSLRTLNVPTIAAMHGFAMGAGVCVALACDMRIAAQGTRIGLNFVRIGLPPGMGATLLLPRIVGPAHAAELLLTGKMIEADEALRIGLVSSIHHPSDLLSAAKTLATEVASAAPIAVAATTRALRRWTTSELDAALTAEAEAQAIAYASDDLGEGLAAARARRAPTFGGK